MKAPVAKTHLDWYNPDPLVFKKGDTVMILRDCGFEDRLEFAEVIESGWQKEERTEISNSIGCGTQIETKYSTTAKKGWTPYLAIKILGGSSCIHLFYGDALIAHFNFMEKLQEKLTR